MSKAKQIFIVGSSRSGTTMMGRILGNHSDVFTFKELHFFGTIWTNNSDKKLTNFRSLGSFDSSIFTRWTSHFFQESSCVTSHVLLKIQR